MFRFLKKLFGGSETDAFGLPPAWSFSDAEPIDEAYRHPDRVDYELDLSTWRYRLKATFCNDDPYAESEISYARMEYEVRRSPSGQWEVTCGQRCANLVPEKTRGRLPRRDLSTYNS